MVVVDMLQISLSAAEQDHLRLITNDLTENLDDGYAYISSLMSDDTNVGDKTKFWFAGATEINSNADTPTNHFIREATKIGLAIQGISGVDQQEISDAIALSVLQGILDRGGVGTMESILGNEIIGAEGDEIEGVLASFDMTIAGWGGSAFFWDTEIGDTGETVGQRISSNPLELEKFLMVQAAGARLVLDELTADAAAAYISSTWFASGIPTSHTDAWSQTLDDLGLIYSTFSDAELPHELRSQIMHRALPWSSSGPAGDPDHVNGWEYDSELGQWTRLNGSGLGAIHDPEAVLEIADAATAGDLFAIRQFRIDAAIAYEQSATPVSFDTDEQLGHVFSPALFGMESLFETTDSALNNGILSGWESATSDLNFHELNSQGTFTTADVLAFMDANGTVRQEIGQDYATGFVYVTTYDADGNFAFQLSQQSDGTAILTQASGTTPSGEPITADSPFDYFLDIDGQLTGFEQTGASGEIFAGNVSYTEYNDFAIVTQGAVNPLTGLPSGIWDTQINTLDGTEPPAFDINDAASLFNSAYGDDGNPDANYSFYENDALFSSIEALGYDPIAFDDFETVGWTTYGTGNSDLLSLNFELDGTDYSIFEDSETISFTTTPWVESDNWGTTFTPELGTTIDWVDSYANVQNRVSPLTFDLDGDGIESSHIYDQSVFFDIDGDGYAEKVGWIDADDGQLAFDANGDGIINDITELFGDDIMPAFEKLALFDTNKNGKIDQGDDDYANLLVWRDFDQDGFSDADELFALDDVSIQIKEISLAETPMDEFQNENYFSGKSTFTRFDNTVGDIVDVHFLNDNVNTWFQGAQSQVYGSTYEVSPEALLLPLSRGYGSSGGASSPVHIAIQAEAVRRTASTHMGRLGKAGRC